MNYSIEKSSEDTLRAISIYTVIGLCGSLVGIILTIASVLIASMVLGLCATLILTAGFINSVVSVTHRKNNTKNKRLASIGIIIPIGILIILSVYYFIHYGS